MDAIIEYGSIRDIILISLAVVSLVGAAIYKIMSKTIERHIRSVIEELTYSTKAYTKLHVGYAYWRFFEKTKDIEDLELAIRLTNSAYTDYAQKLNEKKSDNEVLISKLANNLAHYLAERQKCGKAARGDAAQALQLAAYAYSKIHKYPKYKGEYTDTYKFVHKQFSP